MRKALLGTGVGISLFTAGLVIGLGFIAAAVKFTAPRPELLDLLDVGRVQFGALHAVEFVLVPLACGLLVLGERRLWKAAIVTLVVYLWQVLVIQPPLHARMVARLAGEPVAGGGPHEMYVYVATGLTVMLIVQAGLGLRALTLSVPESNTVSAASAARPSSTAAL